MKVPQVPDVQAAAADGLTWTAWRALVDNAKGVFERCDKHSLSRSQKEILNSRKQQLADADTMTRADYMSRVDSSMKDSLVNKVVSLQKDVVSNLPNVTNYQITNKRASNGELPCPRRRKSVADSHRPLQGNSEEAESPEDIVDDGEPMDDSTAAFLDKLPPLVAPISGVWMVEEVDVALAFYEYQKSAIQELEQKRLTMEEHPDQFLALSSILSLRPNQHSDAVVLQFGADVLDRITGEAQTMCMGTLTEKEADRIKGFVRGVRNEMDEVISKFSPSVGPVERAILASKVAALVSINVSTNSTSSTLEAYLHCVSAVVQGWIHALPLTAVRPSAKELNVIGNDSTWLRPLLQVPDHFHVEWTNTISSSAKASKLSSKRRPDGEGVFVYQAQRAGVGLHLEVKPLSSMNDIHALNLDFVRLGTFGKNATDDLLKRKHLDCTQFGVQIVGLEVIFFALKLRSEGIYVLVECFRCRSPDTLHDIAPFLLKLSNIYQFRKRIILTANALRESTRSSKAGAPMSTPKRASTRGTMTTPTLRQALQGRDSKRRSSIMYNI
ncbi:hypothetical protein HDU85_006874 [Gaertneriomyces sp. JEL0708]|nr:hypothetical protein HDU85_006874 [Gaertneriomyces sp. JEL0708]